MIDKDTREYFYQIGPLLDQLPLANVAVLDKEGQFEDTDATALINNVWKEIWGRELELCLEGGREISLIVETLLRRSPFYHVKRFLQNLKGYVPNINHGNW